MRRVAVACSSAGAGGSGVEGDEEGMTYKGAGVDIDAGTELVRRIGRLAPAIGGFGGLFPFGTILLPISLFVLSRFFFFFFCGEVDWGLVCSSLMGVCLGGFCDMYW